MWEECPDQSCPVVWKMCPDQSCPVVWQKCPAECVGCHGPQWRCLVVQEEQCHTLRLRSPNKNMITYTGTQLCVKNVCVDEYSKQCYSM